MAPNTRMESTIARSDFASILQTSLPWERFSGKTVLITGIAGMIPSYLGKALLALNTGRLPSPVRVVGLTRNMERARAQLRESNGDTNLHLIEADVSQPFQLDERFDFVIHAASPASPVWYTQDPLGTIRVNTEGTARLLEQAYRNQSEGFLYISSSEVYGDTSAFSQPLRETDMGPLDPLAPRSCYGESKRLGEALCAAWWHQYQLPVTIARPFHTFGPGMRLDDGRVFADFVGNLLKGEDIVLKSDGGQRRAFCYLSDAAVAFFRILLQGDFGQAYNVGNPDNLVSMLELAERLSRIYPEKMIQVRRERPIEPSRSSPIAVSNPDVSRLKALDWQPLVNLEEGFRRTVESFKG
jgi:UDP-glucuronate decarboxylase